MSVMFVVLPLAVLMAAAMLAAFVRSALGGQFDDLDAPPHRAIFEDAEVRGITPPESTGSDGGRIP